MVLLHLLHLLLHGQEEFVEFGAEGVPIVVAELEESLGYVVDAVVEMAVGRGGDVLEEEGTGLEGVAGTMEVFAADFEQ